MIVKGVLADLNALSCRQSVTCNQRLGPDPAHSMERERNGKEDECCFCPAESWLQYQGEFFFLTKQLYQEIITDYVKFPNG